MREINIIIVEDSSLIAEGVATLLRKHDFTVSGIHATGEEAVAAVKKDPPDLILMDIKLAGKLDGIETAAMIAKMNSCIPVIYLTDFTDASTVDKAKITNPANYLAKPFRESDLLRAIEIAFYNSISPSGKNVSVQKFLFVKANDQFVKLSYEEILYLKADRAYTEIVTDNKTYTIAKSMNHIHEMINHGDFLRISRSYVVNLNRVTALDGNIIKLGGRSVQMTDDYRDALRQRLNVIK